MNSPQPLLHRIRADLESEIRSGRFKPGDRIPFEHELMKLYGCSRMTVSRALSAVHQNGLIERRKRAGSFVSLKPHRSSLLDVPDLESELTALGHAYRFVMVQKPIRAASEAEAIVNIEGIHFRDNQPMAYEWRAINLKLVPTAAEMRFGPTSPGHWLLAQLNWHSVENHVLAVEADNEMAHHLRIKKGTACLELNRQTWRDGVWVTRVRQIFPGFAYSLMTRLTA